MLDLSKDWPIFIGLAVMFSFYGYVIYNSKQNEKIEQERLRKEKEQKK